MTTQLTIFELSPPKNQLSCVLKMLIENNETMETFKDIPGYEDYYEINRLGDVFSKDRRVRRINWSGRVTTRHVPRKKLTSTINNAGYWVVNLSRHNKIYTQLMHRLLATCFIPNPYEGKKYINHKNGVKSDNRLENLEWCTQSENSLHSYEVLGRIAGMTGRLGVLCKHSKKVIAVKDGITNEYAATAEAARELNLSTGNICSVLKGRRPHTKGYKFFYQ